MTNTNPTPEKSAANSDQASKLNSKIKEAYSKLSDEDVKLYSSNKDQFFCQAERKTKRFQRRWPKENSGN